MRFLFCSFETPGFIYPAVAIARQLRERGHEVAFVSDMQTSQFLSEQNFFRIQRGKSDGNSFLVAQWARPLPVAIQVKHIEYAIERFNADALVGQSLTLGPLLVAQKHQIPVGLLGFCTYLWPKDESVNSSQEKLESEVRCRWRHGEMLKALNQARELFRLPPYEGSCGETPLLGDLFLVRSVPELEVNIAQVSRRVHLVGSCLWEPEGTDPEVVEWLREAEVQGLPLIYVQHGRFFHIPSFWPRLVEALEGFRCKVAASCGRLDSEVIPLPKGSLLRPHLSQGSILERASVVLATANTTAVLGALQAGVPSLLIPGGGEQPDVAELAERVGVAKCLSPEGATSETIRSGIQELLEVQDYRRRAGYYKSAFSRINGTELAACLLERLAATREPVLRDNELSG